MAAPPYLIILALLLSFERRNPEDGMLVGMLIMLELPLWVGIGAFLAAALKAAQLDRRFAAGAWLLLGLSGIVSYLSLALMGTDPDWLSVVPAGLPLLFLAFGLWARDDSGKPAERRRIPTAFTAAVLALLALYAAAAARDIERTARAEAAAEDEMARYEADYERNLRAAPRLDALLDYLHEGERQERTLAAIGRLPSRQADAIRLLGADRPHVNLWWLHAFNLAPDAALCTAYRGALDRMAGRLDPGAGVYTGELEMERDNVAWLSRNGCDLSASLRNAAARLRRFNQELTNARAAEFEAMASRASTQP